MRAAQTLGWSRVLHGFGVAMITVDTVTPLAFESYRHALAALRASGSLIDEEISNRHVTSR